MRNETLCRNCQHLLVCRHLEKYADARTKVVSINKENEADIFEAIVVCKQYLKIPEQLPRRCPDAGTYVVPGVRSGQEISTYPSGESIPTSAFDKYLKGGL